MNYTYTWLIAQLLEIYENLSVLFFFFIFVIL